MRQPNAELQPLKNSNMDLETTSKQQQFDVADAPTAPAQGWSRLLFLAGCAATLGSAVPAGYCIGVMNSPAAHMRAWCNATLIERYDLRLSDAAIELLWSAIVSVFLVGGALGSLSGAWAANRYGRRGAFIGCGALLLLGALLFYWCRLCGSVEMLLLGRFAVGLAAGLTTASLPMYLSELAPLAMRGTLGVFCAVGLSAGVVLGQICSLRSIFGGPDYWHLALSCYALLVVACYAPALYYPESPKWLFVMRGERVAARDQLRRLRGCAVTTAQLDKEMADLEAEALLSGEQVSSFAAVLRNGSLTLPLVIVCAFQGGQQLSGINAIFYYSVSIFQRAGLSASAAEWANLGAGSLNLLISLCGPVLMGRFNRRPLMLGSSSFCALSLLSFALMLRFIESVSWFASGCIACIFLYIFFFQFGIGPIPFFIGAELFEVAPRPVAMSLGSLSSWSCNFLIGMTFPSLQLAWGAYVFLPCAITCLLLCLLTQLYLPETRGRDPAQVAPLMAHGFKSKCN